MDENALAPELRTDPSGLKDRIDQAALLVEEFNLTEVELSGSGWKVRLSSEPVQTVAGPSTVAVAEGAPRPAKAKSRPKVKAEAPPVGNPITSPMMGIYYSSPNPGADPYVSEGQVVQVGEVVGLIEAMKVFNEITTPFAGVVAKMSVENGQLVQPGETLLVIR